MLVGTDDIYINLDADYTQALKGINISTGPIDHGVNATDLTALQNFRDRVFSPGAGIPSSINNIGDEFNVSIYPNPTADKLFIDFGSNENNADKIVITDLAGKIIKENTLLANNEINVSNIAKGVYVVKFYTRSLNVANRKIVVQ